MFLFAFDGIVAKCIVRELSKELSGGRIDKVLQPEADEIVLVIGHRAKPQAFAQCQSTISQDPHY